MGDTIHPKDRISKLSDVIIHHIMSYLTTKEVAQTSILSKRWNYLWTSFPILDFDQNYFVRFNMTCAFPLESFGPQVERFHKFLGFVDASLLQFCKLKFPMQKLRLSIGPLDVIGSSFLLDKWIGLAVENEVKELNFHLISRNTVHLPRTIELDDIYILPEAIFSAKSMSTLEVCGCKLEQPSGSAGFHFLKNVKLVKVLLNEQIVQMLITECPLLENLLLHYCSGLKRFRVSDALKLKVVEFFTLYDEVGSIEIAAPCIQKFSLWFSKRERSCAIDISKCPLLKYLDLKGADFWDEEFDNLVSKYPLLENLFVSECNFLEKVIISSIQLKKLQFVNCSGLKDIDIDTPNLVSFYYEGNSVPKSSINAPCSWDVRFENESALNARWFLRVKDFLGVNQIEDLFITLKSEKISFKLDEFRKWSPSVPCEVENLHLDLTMRPSNYTAFLDGLFSICYPRYMSIVAYGGDFELFLKWLNRKLRNRDAKCCNSQNIKCWRHYLKDAEIYCFQPGDDDNEPYDINDLNKELPELPLGNLYFRLDWLCYEA